MTLPRVQDVPYPVDGRDHVALSARVDSSIVVVGRFIRLPTRPERAEIAFSSPTRFQRRGVGRILRTALLGRARALGSSSFLASVLAANHGIRRLLCAAPLSVVSDAGDLFVVRLPVELQPERGRPFR